MAGRFAKGQKVRVPEGLDVPRAHQYTGQIGTATGNVGFICPNHDQADFGGRCFVPTAIISSHGSGRRVIGHPKTQTYAVEYRRGHFLVHVAVLTLLRALGRR